MNRQAGFFRALADHLDVHDDLPQVYVDLPTHDGRVALQLEGFAGPGALADWAVSLGATALVVRRVGGNRVHLHAVGTIADFTVQVWCSAGQLDDTDLTNGEVIHMGVPA